MARTSLPIVWGMMLALIARPSTAAERIAERARALGIERGIIACCGLPDGGAGEVVELARAGLTVYFQSPSAADVAAVRSAAEKDGTLGSRIFADQGPIATIRLADQVADGLFVSQSASEGAADAELLRVVRPRATVRVGDRERVKPVPAGIDEWTHPFHGADNNPQSRDQLVKGDFRTQFIAEPKFSPMPEQTVVAGGRMYKAMGHIAHKANQNAMLNTLLCVNAYNGTILWKRSLPESFMLHRNTMVATEDALYMGDHQSCKIIDGKTGEVRDELTVGKDISDGPVWKWMSIQDGILYAMVGNPEIQISTVRSNVPGLGHWPWGMWEGHDYENPERSFGFGRTLVAIDLRAKERLWHYRDETFLDTRAVCMKGNRIYAYCPEKFVACIDASDGRLLWKNADKDLLEAIGPNQRAQHYLTGYATASYMKCDDRYLLFAGPQRERMVVASAVDGKLLWTYPAGNLQLVLRDDAIYGAGQQGTTGVRLDYATGNELAKFPARRACTRATGCLDSIFFRATGGTVRVLTESNTAHHIAPMRPPCQDGVVISNGHLYWGPWMCGCELSLYGNIGLAPVSADQPSSHAEESALRVADGHLDPVRPLGARDGDWLAYRGGSRRDDLARVAPPPRLKLAWTADISGSELPAAPVAAGNLVFVADRRGIVRALDVDGHEVWKAYTAGPIYYPPAIESDRLFVGSADGRVYAMEAATGRLLWTHRVGPPAKRIPVFGKLISSFPIAGGVVAEQGTVYAAAGITHYDGTHVVALDAITGAVRAENRSTGRLAPEVDGGISMQGELALIDGELRFLGGGVYEVARFDATTLQCLNAPKIQVHSQFRTAFYPYYPEYGKFVSLETRLTDGNLLTHDASYEGSVFGNLALTPKAPADAPMPVKDEARDFLRRRGQNQPAPKPIWTDTRNRRFTSFIVAGDRLLATGHTEQAPDQPFLVAMRVQDGVDLWSHPLPADAVKGGTAIDADGRLFVALENGRLACFAPDGANTKAP
ncbi:MAG: hypothetical protein FJ297_13595 [Planctomycetes bacterium]|nr:hypothetical protein [Planctomycetota bacterium]